MALGLESPWQVTDLSFAGEGSGRKELHLHIGFPRGSRFPDDTGAACPVHDTVEREWQHLGFFEHHCFLHCGVPRIKASNGKVKTVEVPWSRPGSGFTLLFEAFAMALIEREMPVNRVAEILGVNPQRLWTLFNHWIDKARKADDPSSITQLGVDETSSRKGHKYVTLGVDMDAARVIHACEGKGKDTLKHIQQRLESKGVAKEQITQLSMDLSPAFIAGAAASFPAAAITFDRFHVVKLLNEAMNKVQDSELFKKAEDVTETAWNKAKEMSQDFVESAQHFAEKTAESLEDLAERMKGDTTETTADSNQSSTPSNNPTEAPQESSQTPAPTDNPTEDKPA